MDPSSFGSSNDDDNSYGSSNKRGNDSYGSSNTDSTVPPTLIPWFLQQKRQWFIWFI